MKKIYLKNIRDIRGRKPQFLALLAIVALGILSFVSSISAYQNLFSSYKFAYDELKFADHTIKLEHAPANIIDKIKDVDGVKSAEGRLVFDASIEIEKDSFAQARLIGTPKDRRPTVNDVKIEEGRYFKSSDKDVVLLEKHFADYYQKKVGDFIAPQVIDQKKTLEIIGIIASPEYLVVSPSRQDILPSARRFAVLFVPEEQLESYLGVNQTINEVVFLIEEEASKTNTTKKVKDVLKPYGIIESFDQEDQPSNAALSLDLEGYREIAYLLPTLILIVASFSIYISLSRLVRSQRREIGLAKALGYSNSSIVWHYLIYSLVIAFLGSVAGILIGQLLSGTITRAYATELGIPLVKVEFYPEFAIASIFMSLVFCLAAGFIPARSSSKMKPAEAMHTDPSLGIQKSYVPLAERFLTLFGKVSLTLKIPIRNLVRVRRRSFYIIIGVVFAFILILSSWSFLDSMDWALSSQVAREKYDLSATFSTLEKPDLINTIEDIDGVEKVEASLLLPIKLKKGQEDIDTYLTCMKPDATFHKFSVVRGEEAEKTIAEKKIIITSFAAKKLGVDIGDPVGIETPHSSIQFEVGSINEESTGIPVFIDYDEGLKLTDLRSPVYNNFYVSTLPGQEIKVKKELFILPGVTQVMIKDLIVEDWEELMGLLYAFIGVIVLFSSIMAFIVIFNTLNTSVLEREREFATMRTIGASKTRLFLMITIENLAAGLASLPFGLILGYLTGAQLMKAFQSELFDMKLVIYPSTYLVVSVLIFSVLLISEIPALRHIAKINLAEATKIIE